MSRSDLKTILRGRRVRLAVAAAALFMWSAVAVGQTTSTQTTDMIVTQYLAVAFGEQFPSVPSARVPGLLPKRNGDVPTHVYLVVSSLADNDAALNAAKKALTDVLEDLKTHAPGFSYDYRDETSDAGGRETPA